MLKLSGLYSVLVVLAFADETKKKDKDLIQGTWVGVKMVVEGEEEAEEKAKKMSFIFKGEMLEVSGDKEVEKYTLKLDDSKKPKHIEFGEKGSFVPGIYELDGDTLKICWNKNTEGRPTDFKPTAKNKWSMAVLKRKGK